MFARLRLVAFTLVALAVPSFGNAQQTTADTTTVAAGPRLETTATAFRGLEQPVDSAASMQRARQRTNRPVTLMIVGGAAIVLGSVIDDPLGTLFVVGGAVSLLYGLYLYLQ